MQNWSNEKSAELYGINEWGAGYFKINAKGNISICPNPKNSPGVDLKELTEDLLERGIRAPILIRFPDIVKERINLLSSCFNKAISDNNYQGEYCGVYPIKVNQNRDLVKHIVEYGREVNLGLEAGSKPELLVVLAQSSKNTESLIICNGFKDEEYIETALLAQKLGRKIIIVVDRKSELPLILKVADRLNTKAAIGLRVKLYAKGSGKWVESSGARSKFGLTPHEICESFDMLREHNALDCLRLVHFHIGSQVKSIQSIKESLKEGTKYFAELYKMGATELKYLDVGGGLGVDYDGTRSSDSSTNYTEQEYANDVIDIVIQTCKRHEVPHPNIVTESGRALVAHHSILIFNVLGANQLSRDHHDVVPRDQDSPVIQNLLDIYNNLNTNNINESYNDVLSLRDDALRLYTLGYLSLEERAKAEKLLWANFTKLHGIVKNNPDYEDLASSLEGSLCDTYYCNFSIFQSMPDAWAVKHHFPAMPIHRLNEEPSRRAILVDLTCDSDGKIDSFVENFVPKSSLAVHTLNNDEAYYLGVFLLGAYQEALGDLHNLFGDTDSVDVVITENGYSVEHVVEGDSVSEVLSYSQYDRKDLVSSIRMAIERGICENKITKNDAKILMRNYEEGLLGYTYLE